MKTFKNPKRILIVKLGALGDVIMAEGVMRCIDGITPMPISP